MTEKWQVLNLYWAENEPSAPATYDLHDSWYGTRIRAFDTIPETLNSTQNYII